MNLEWLPGAKTLKTYRGEWLKSDLVAGIVLTTLLVPQGMAYAELAGLPVITGLYTTILCLVGYALFGPSRMLVLGPDSSLGPMIAQLWASWFVPGERSTAAWHCGWYRNLIYCR